MVWITVEAEVLELKRPQIIACRSVTMGKLMPRDRKSAAQIPAAKGTQGWSAQLVSAYNCVPPTDLRPPASPFQDLLVVTIKQGG